MTDENGARPALVIGDGIAARATTLALLESGVAVCQLFRTPGEGTESCARHDGIDAALGPDDTPERHAEDLARAAGPLGSAEALAALAEAGPELVRRLQRLGIPFEREKSGALALGPSPGASAARSARAGSQTARHVCRRLGHRLSSFEASGTLKREPSMTLLDFIQDESGTVVGCVVRSEVSGEIEALRADGVCLATGGWTGLHFAPSHQAPSMGAASGLAFRRGALLSDPDLVRVSPLGYSSGGFVRVLPERLLELGGKLDSGLLDLSELDRGGVRKAAGAALAAHAEHTGLDAYSEPVPVLTVATRSLGGLWVDFDAADPSSERSHSTSLRGLYAVGGATALYFGAEIFSGTPLAAALFGAERLARAIRAHRAGLGRSAFGLPERLFDEGVERQRERIDAILERDDDDAPRAFDLERELRELVSSEAVADASSTGFDAFGERLASATAGDREPVANAGLETLLSLAAVLPVARAVAVARARRQPASAESVLLGWSDEAGVVAKETTK